MIKTMNASESAIFQDWVEDCKDSGKYDIFDNPRGENISIENLFKVLKDPGCYESDLMTDNEAMNSIQDIFEERFKEFLKDNFVDDEKEGFENEDDIYNNIKDIDQFRLVFEDICVNLNWIDIFNFEILVLKFLDIERTDDEDEQWNVIKMYANKKAFKNVLINTSFLSGNWYVGSIVNAQDIIKAKQEGKKTMNVESSIIGVHDFLDGDGMFDDANDTPIEIDLEHLHIDHGEYGIGGVFGNHDWKW